MINENDNRPAFLRFASYDEWRKTTDLGNHDDLGFPALGLCGEAGEVAEKIKKIIRDQHGVWGLRDKDQIVLELGDVLWYLATIANRIGSSLAEVALKNVDKLESRKARGVLRGSGDER